MPCMHVVGVHQILFAHTHLSNNYHRPCLGANGYGCNRVCQVESPTPFLALVTTSNATAIPTAPTRLLLVVPLRSSHDAMILPAWRMYLKYRLSVPGSYVILPQFHNIARSCFLRSKFDHKFNQRDRLRREQKLYH